MCATVYSRQGEGAMKFRHEKSPVRRPGLVIFYTSYADRLFHRNGRKPVMAIRDTAFDDAEELLLDRLRDRPHRSVADLDLVDGTNRRDLGSRAAEEHLVSDIEHFAWN